MMKKRDARSEFGVLVEEAFGFLIEDGRFMGPERQEDGCFFSSRRLSRGSATGPA
jgi:hypothetical protein